MGDSEPDVPELDDPEPDDPELDDPGTDPEPVEPEDEPLEPRLLPAATATVYRLPEAGDAARMPVESQT